MTRTAEQFHERMWDILDPVDTEYVAAPAPDAQAISSLEAAVGFRCRRRSRPSVSAPTACA